MKNINYNDKYNIIDNKPNRQGWRRLRQNVYWRFFAQHFKQLTKIQQQFCRDYSIGDYIDRKRLYITIRRIRERLGITVSLDKKHVQIDEIVEEYGSMRDFDKKERTRQALQRLDETFDNIEEINPEELFGEMYGNYSLYEHMQINNRKKLILGCRNKTDIDDNVLVDFISGLYRWKELTEKYLERRK